MYNKLLHCEDLANQKNEEINSTDDVYGKIFDYQKHEVILENIRKFNYLEMKNFELILNFGKAVMKEVVEMVAEKKKDCTKIWDSLEEMMEIIRFPRLENLEEAISCML